MPPTVRPDHLSDEPANSDRFVGGLSESIGGPLGDHAVRQPVRMPGGGRFWTPARVVLLLICAMLSFHWMQKAPCRDAAWVDMKQYKYFCYTDVLALYYAEGLNEGKVPYADHPVEYPVLTGIFMGALGLPVHSLGERGVVENEGQTFYDLNAIVLGAFGIAAVGAILSVRRRRPWDAAMFALAPALFVSATVNWDLFTVGLAAIAMAYWAKRKPVLAGIFLGMATAAKFYPMLIVGALLVLSLRSGKWRDFFITVGTAVVTWLAVNVPIAYLYYDSWLRFFDFNSQRGIDWGTLWYIGAHFPRGSGQYGFPFFQQLDSDPEHSKLNILYLGLFVICCIGILVLGLSAPQQPRLAQLAFLIVAAFLITGKVWSQQYVLWLLPLAVLARPKWGAFLAWQAAEVIYFVSFYGELMGASGRQVFPEGVFVLASILRLVTLCVLVGYVIRDIRNPELDAVRTTYDGEDPDGGVYNDREPDTAAADPPPTTALVKV
ncbi:glycosyltransferase 87 family protein [Dactylosporangium sp. AC04546]|uniref:glycosyltransferase family 87 protein n=1 Tax=Dactylosporangium sp. AC04546 TaxID=2862460 RepID=UPI001EE07BB8|nr:glycosyltransferase 87 family protein [Dactylosporangium sp. AC04546]WVK83857.1 glycosyltransferase 87 family protein [Dactylosporangium sp. AC04546]